VEDKVVVITGSNTGIGKETAVGLASLGATVVLACRNQEKAQAAAAEVKERSGQNRVHLVALDLADLASVRTCAEWVTGTFDRLDVLVNNAGGMWSSRETTQQGFEQTFGVNHLGHFYLTNLLLPQLKASAPSRIVNLTSVGHHYAVGGIKWDDLQRERRYRVMDVYGQSKLANLLFTRELARRLDPTQTTANAAHPGPVRSGFGMDGDLTGLTGLGNRIIRPFEISAQAGARTPIRLASDPSLAGQTGMYWARGRRGHMSRAAKDDDAAARLWDVSEQLIEGVGFGLDGSSP
jgi:NAD(P)-dependent dehydrogenase (short-subunit alcohol dehydrogenase family)